jgi:hypothetical protein
MCRPERLERGCPGDLFGPHETFPILCCSKPALAVVGPVQNIFFRTIHYFTSLVPIGPASWAGSRSAFPVCGDHCPVAGDLDKPYSQVTPLSGVSVQARQST